MIFSTKVSPNIYILFYKLLLLHSTPCIEVMIKTKLLPVLINKIYCDIW